MVAHSIVGVHSLAEHAEFESSILRVHTDGFGEGLDSHRERLRFQCLVASTNVVCKFPKLFIHRGCLFERWDTFDEGPEEELRCIMFTLPVKDHPSKEQQVPVRLAQGVYHRPLALGIPFLRLYVSIVILSEFVINLNKQKPCIEINVAVFTDSGNHVFCFSHIATFVHRDQSFFRPYVAPKLVKLEEEQGVILTRKFSSVYSFQEQRFGLTQLVQAYVCSGAGFVIFDVDSWMQFNGRLEIQQSFSISNQFHQ
mmetsp:Transcript_11652/g.23452  ORF Transcript_11652/g.23452 Transcript_11652/m.23452 type:complete len:254 (-) Transcript_11652:2442-3203(-)